MSRTDRRPRRTAPLAALLTIGLALAWLSGTSPAGATTTTKKDVTIAVTSGYNVINGKPVTVSVKAPRATAGRTAVLLRQVGTGVWVNVGSARVSSTGAATVSGLASKMGINHWKVRIAQPVSSGTILHVSNVVATLVSTWFSLYDLSTVDSNNWETYNDANIGAQHFSKAVGAGTYSSSNTYWGEYNLGYHCSKFNATIGVDNNSSSGSSIHFDPLLDGADHDLGTKSLGQGTAVTFSVQGVLRLRLSHNFVNPGGVSMQGDWGNARVLCSAYPR
ncbi:NPCBM/NEW2 domain-containing protein [Nocardioides ultimimeridianus]